MREPCFYIELLYEYKNSRNFESVGLDKANWQLQLFIRSQRTFNPIAVVFCTPDMVVSVNDNILVARTFHLVHV